MNHQQERAAGQGRQPPPGPGFGPRVEGSGQHLLEPLAAAWQAGEQIHGLGGERSIEVAAELQQQLLQRRLGPDAQSHGQAFQGGATQRRRAGLTGQMFETGKVLAVALVPEQGQQGHIRPLSHGASQLGSAGGITAATDQIEQLLSLGHLGGLAGVGQAEPPAQQTG